MYNYIKIKKNADAFLQHAARPSLDLPTPTIPAGRQNKTFENHEHMTRMTTTSELFLLSSVKQKHENANRSRALRPSV